MDLSSLSHTWIIDLDGTIFEHNGYLRGEDILLPGVKEFWLNIPANDFILILTARSKKFYNPTIESLEKFNLRYNQIMFDLPTGERILINDVKPSGLNTAIAINLQRNNGLNNLNEKFINTTKL